MKRFLMITLMAITAVAVVAAPGWAAGGRMLSDRQLDGIYAGDDVDDASNADANSSASHSGEIFVAGAASSAAAATASDVASAVAVDIDNDCSTTAQCKLIITDRVKNNGGSTGNNAQSIANTLASVNAVQINVMAGGGDQSNTAYSTGVGVGEIDSNDAASASSSADTLVDTTNTPPWASADSSASSAASAASALAYATPRVEIQNDCTAGGGCKLKIFNDVKNNGNATAANAQSILNTVASVNAVQMNVMTGSGSQSNTAFSGGGLAP